jgi:hypothetical protein
MNQENLNAENGDGASQGWMVKKKESHLCGWLGGSDSAFLIGVN